MATKNKVKYYEDVDGGKYVLAPDQDAELVVGDYGWSPNNGYVIPICEDDDLILINMDYIKVVPVKVTTLSIPTVGGCIIDLLKDEGFEVACYDKREIVLEHTRELTKKEMQKICHKVGEYFCTFATKED